MSLRLRFSANARRELLDIFLYLSERDEIAANRVVNAIENSCKNLAQFPCSARMTDMPGIRVKLFQDFPTAMTPDNRSRIEICSKH